MNDVRYIALLIIFISSQFLLSSQESYLFEEEIQWEDNRTEYFNGSPSFQYMYFRGAEYPVSQPLPFLYKQIDLHHLYEIIEVEIIHAEYENVPLKQVTQTEGYDLIEQTPLIKASAGIQAKKPVGFIYILPLRKNSENEYERITRISYRVHCRDIKKKPALKNTLSTKSVLREGIWHKIAVVDEGVHIITYNDLISYGIDPDEINPATLQIFGNGGGMLPEINYETFVTDLIENPVYVAGEEDGTFDTEDYILFYGDGQITWDYNVFSQKFNHAINYYSDTTYYFLTFNQSAGKRIITEPSLSDIPTDTVNSFIDYAVHEQDLVSIARTGKEWFGEYFNQSVTSRTFPFSFPNISNLQKAYIRLDVAGRSTEVHTLTAFFNGEKLTVATISGISPTATTILARKTTIAETFDSADPELDIEIVYDVPTSTSQAWLNFIELNVYRNLVFSGPQMQFRDILSKGKDKIARFEMDHSSQDDITVWEITDPTNVKNVETTNSNNQIHFTLRTDTLREFIAFDHSGFFSPHYAGPVVNQNIHGIASTDMVIVAHPLFIEQAEELAKIHRDHDGLSVYVITVDKIFNEFSSGAPDVSAIRNFMRLMYEQADSGDEPKYLLLFGDGSYDPKNRIMENTNFIPTYQSQESLLITSSFVSDDFFGLYDFGEGGNANGTVDIGIGRIPVQSIEEADHVVHKIRHYLFAQQQVMGDWRNIVCFVADDEDQNLHFKQAEEQADSVARKEKTMNIDKIYFDAYQQTTTSGGDRYPNANEALNKRIEEGALILNYTGHGGEEGWSVERVLTIADINQWENLDNLPFFVTATCEFSRYDEPDKTTGGELVLLQPDGGGIGLITTTRLAFAQSNFNLNKRFYEYVFETNGDGERYRLGDLIRICKTPPNENIKNHHLLGDPALTIAYPHYNITTISINGNMVSGTPDTINAMQEVTVTGEITDENGNRVTGFNGTLYPAVYDKPSRLSTLGNDPKSYPAPFTLQKDILHKGVASVNEGAFSFSFLVPKDIAYQYGTGKISYYAEDGVSDASGFFEGIVIGGIYEDATTDNNGPQIDLFLNDNRFISGDIVNVNPLLIARLSDESGINFLNNGIGHDIVATIDEDQDNGFALNDYYQPDPDTYQSGEILYPLHSLTPGEHTLTLKAWDLKNNSSSVTIRFIVSDNISLAAGNMKVFPNPFRDYTEFTFEHNQFNSEMLVTIYIYTLDGSWVNSLGPVNLGSDGYFSRPLLWDGTDYSGNRLRRGIYIYNVIIKGNKDSKSELSGKLILLR